MDNPNYTTEHRKGQHLLNEERYEIVVRLKDGWSIYRIAKHLGRAYNTIKDEVERGTVTLYNGKVKRYKADQGKLVYLENREHSTRRYRVFETAPFLEYVVKQFKNEHWSLDAIFGYALHNELFKREEMVCTKTLYNYVSLGLLPIKNIDLPEKLKRNTAKSQAFKNKKKLGRSIEERPESVELRNEFGHWEIDSVLGLKNENEPVVITLVERMTRMCLWIKAKNHTAEAMQEAFEEVVSMFLSKKNQVFKTVTETTVPNLPHWRILKNTECRYISRTRIHPARKVQMNVIIKCCADSFQRASLSVPIQPKIFAILPIV